MSDALDIDPLQGSVGGEKITVMFPRVERKVWLGPESGRRQLNVILVLLHPLEVGELPEAETPGLVIIRTKDEGSAPVCQSLQSSRTGHSLGEVQSVGVDLSTGHHLTASLQAEQVVHKVSQLHLSFQGSVTRRRERDGYLGQQLAVFYLAER